MYYGFENFKQDADKLVEQITNSGKFYEYVVGVMRGGAIPAVYLSHRLGIPMRGVSWSTFHKDQMRESALDIAEDINEGKSILLVDDILDSGRTMNELLTDWGQTRDKIGIAVLVYNLQQNIKPDYFGTVIDREVDKDWINFWWEKDVDEK
jgi:hypoxanthine phosphoribosyltransferase